MERIASGIVFLRTPPSLYVVRPLVSEPWHSGTQALPTKQVTDALTLTAEPNNDGAFWYDEHCAASLNP